MGDLEMVTCIENTFPELGRRQRVRRRRFKVSENEDLAKAQGSVKREELECPPRSPPPKKKTQKNMTSLLHPTRSLDLAFSDFYCLSNCVFKWSSKFIILTSL